ncbi:MAG: hypothetical protein JWQ19_3633 [Subtercola sp.]|nr:hypothetical protein [Subtercola sp.]
MIATPSGLKFVDAGQIERISTSAVQTTVTPDLVGSLAEPDGAPLFTVDGLQDVGGSLSARLGRLFRREHWKPSE